MIFKKIVGWTLIQAFFVVSFLPPIFEAQQREFQAWREKTARINQRLDKTREAFAKAADSLSVKPAKAADENPTEDAGEPLVFMGVDVAEEAMVGEVVPIAVAVVVRNEPNVKIDKVNLTITDPPSGKEHFKDSYINRKKEDRFIFYYGWDTHLAKTNPDTGATKHQVIAKAYQEKNGAFEEVLSATAEIRIKPYQTFDPLSHGFWRGYLKLDGSFDPYWRTKLGCQNIEECRTKEAILGKLAAAVNNGDFSYDTEGKPVRNNKLNVEDVEEINTTYARFTHKNETAFPSGEDAIADAFGINLAMTDLAFYLEELMSARDGANTLTIAKETLAGPENMAIMKVINDYSLKISSYDPQNVDEMKQMDIWPEIEQKIMSEMSQAPEDIIESWDQIQPLGAQTGAIAPNSLNAKNKFPLIKEAKAIAILPVLAIAAIVGFTGWDVYQFVRKPNVTNAALVGLDLLAGAGLLLKAGRIVMWGGRLLSKIPGVARAYGALKSAFTMYRIGLMAKLGGWWTALSAKAPWITKAGGWIGSWFSKGWAYLLGRLKKVWDSVRAVAILGVWATLRNWIEGGDCGCTRDIMKGNLIAVFILPICSIICVFIKAMLELAKKLLDWMPQALEARGSPKSILGWRFFKPAILALH